MAKSIDSRRLTQIKNEILMAEAINREELEPIAREAIERYTGVHVPGFGTNWDVVLNEIYPIIQFNLPSIFFRNPRVFLKPRNKTFIAKKRNPITGEMESVQLDSTKSARTQEAIINYTLQEIKYKRETRKVLLDALLFPYGVLWHGYKGDFGMTEEQSIFIKDEQVFVRRISPTRFIKDPSVNIANIDEAKWVGRIIDIPLQDLIEDDQLNVNKKLIRGFKGFGEKVGSNTAERLKKMGGGDEMAIARARRSLFEFANKEYQSSNMANFVRVYEIFLRPTKKEQRDGDNGYILLLTEEQPEPLRVSDWKIKAEGFPSKILEFNMLNDGLFGIPDIDTYKGAADQKNAIVNLQLRNAQENSKVWVGISKEGAGEPDIQRIQQGDNTIVFFESGNPRDRMFVASPGSMGSSELYLIDQRIKKEIEDKSGVTDLKRGFIQSGEESATSVKIRSAGAGARPAYRQDIMADFLRESCLYLNQLLKQFVPFQDAVRIIGSLDIEWSDNPSKEELQADVDVEIDVISMLPENPEMEMRQLNTILTMMVQALQSPEVRTKLAQEGKTFNLAPLIEQILLRMKVNDPEVFRNIRPEESEGYVSVKEVREAKENVNAALMGTQIPFPPTPNDDHVAKLEVYTSIAGLLEKAGQVSDQLMQLIQIHQALLAEIQEKQATPGQTVKLKQPQVSTIGTL